MQQLSERIKVFSEIIKFFSEIIKILPSLLLLTFLILLVTLYYHPIRYEMIPKIAGFKAFGIELSFARKSLDFAVESQKKKAKEQMEASIQVPDSERKRAIDRAAKHIEILSGAKILWVDDFPEFNRDERKMLRYFRIENNIAKNSAQALELLKYNIYDLVISDIHRSNPDDPNGIEFLKELRETDKETPVIFYIGFLDPEKGVPVNSFGITNRPDELIHLIVDALDRRKS
jgi:CheY-like chemotaxis protein